MPVTHTGRERRLVFVKWTQHTSRDSDVTVQHTADHLPGYAARAKGCEIWDLDGVHYYDMTTNGIGACILGYADPDVSAAVKICVDNGSMSSLNPPEEVYLADRLCEIHPWAENVRFARTGGEICAIAVRIARATTGRDIVAICGYHGWCDWYIAANISDNHQLDGVHLPGRLPNGVPRQLNGTSFTFMYGDTQAFDALIRDYGDRLACVIMEPLRHKLPTDDFLFHVRDSAHKVGALLIFDEITIGWRLNFGGSHLQLGLHPDMATFAKAMAALTFHGDESANICSQHRSPSNRTKCTCSRRGRACAPCPEHIFNCAHSLCYRTTRSAFRRRDARVSCWDCRCSYARSSCCRSACICLPF